MNDLTTEALESSLERSEEFVLDGSYFRAVMKRIIGRDLYQNLSDGDYHGMYAIAYEWISSGKLRIPVEKMGPAFLHLERLTSGPLKNFDRPVRLEDLMELEKIIARRLLFSHIMYCYLFLEPETGRPWMDPIESWHERYSREELFGDEDLKP